METEDLNQAFNAISAWATSDVAFCHLNIHRDLTFTSRASLLIEKCCSVAAMKSVIYAVGSDRERDLLGDKICDDIAGSVTGLDLTNRICIVTYAELYQWAKLKSGSRAANEGVLVLCEMDIHYSLEFVLSILCLISNQKSSPVYVHTMVISHLPLEKNLARAIKLVGAPALRIQQISLLSRKEIPVGYTNVDEGRFRDEVSKQIGKALQKGDNVLMFCHPGDRAHVTRSLAEQQILHTSHCVSQTDVDSLVDFCQPALGELRAGILFVEDGSTLPLEICHLGLVVISRRREAAMFDPRTSHIVRTSVTRSKQEIRNAIMDMYLACQEQTKKAVVLGDELDSDECPMPPRRVENGQNLAFLFEVLQLFPDVKLSELLSCFVSDFRSIFALVPRLLMGGWIREEPDPAICRGYLVNQNNKTTTLISLLPIFGYNFEPAAFLASFAGGSNPAITRAAIRMAAISHHGFAFLPSYDPVEFALSNHQPLKRVLDDFPNAFEDQKLLPESLLQHGILWIALATWQAGAIKYQNYSDLPETGEEIADVTQPSSVSRLLRVNLKLASQIADLVNQLERLFGIGAAFAPRSVHFELQPADCGRIQDELLKAWMYKTYMVRHKDKDNNLLSVESVQTTDLVGGKVKGVTLSNTNAHLMIEALMNGDIGVDVNRGVVTCALARDILKSGHDCWVIEPMAIIPLSVIRRWEQSQGLGFSDKVKSTYPIH
ncbi:hypothetical protein FDECE_11006 [Fusarium decemcellulare]|nr:hypothetical protein FDECE_11006 [Fusarium decemcellulare]